MSSKGQKKKKKWLVYVTLGLLLQRSRHVLEADSRGVVAIPRHAPAGWGRESDRQEIERDRLRNQEEETRLPFTPSCCKTVTVIGAVG